MEPTRTTAFIFFAFRLIPLGLRRAIFKAVFRLFYHASVKQRLIALHNLKCAFPDHHRYTAEDLGRIEQDAGLARADVVLATEKDLVKLQGIPPALSRICALAVETEILEGADGLETALRKVVPARRRV